MCLKRREGTIKGLFIDVPLIVVVDIGRLIPLCMSVTKHIVCPVKMPQESFVLMCHTTYRNHQRGKGSP